MIKRACWRVCACAVTGLRTQSLSHTHTHYVKKKGRIFTLMRLVSHDWLSLVADLLSSPNSVL